MKNSYSNIFAFNKKILRKTINELKNGNVVGLPTETVYGLGGNAYQKNAIKKHQSFVIVDDLLATGGTVKCVADMLKEAGKEISGLSVVAELGHLNAKDDLPFPVKSQIIF